MSERKSAFEPEEEHENLERWLLTYADMITLLTAFFILLYSMSVLNMAKFRKLAVSVRSGFDGPQQSLAGPSIVEKGQVNVAKPAIHPIDQPARTRQPERRDQGSPAMAAPPAALLAAVAEARNLLAPHGTARLREGRGMWTIELAGGEIFFSKDSAELTPRAVGVLRDLARVLPASIRLVGVEGFCSASAKAGFRLSTERALAVVDVLGGAGVSESKLSATGFGVKAPMGLGGRDYVRIVVQR